MTSIHQSQFLPWLPFWFKVLASDTFVVLDNIQYQKNGVQNRNQIKTPQGALWLTVPVSVRLGDPINRVRVADLRCYDRLRKTLEGNYRRAPDFTRVAAVLDPIFSQRFPLLHELNDHLFRMVATLLGVTATVRYASAMPATSTKDALVREMLFRERASAYLSGPGALAYMDRAAYAAAGIAVSVAKFSHEPYPQQWPAVGFVPHCSIIDLLCNDAAGARAFILRCGTVTSLT